MTSMYLARGSIYTTIAELGPPKGCSFETYFRNGSVMGPLGFADQGTAQERDLAFLRTQLPTESNTPEKPFLKA